MKRKLYSLREVSIIPQWKWDICFCQFLNLIPKFLVPLLHLHTSPLFFVASIWLDLQNIPFFLASSVFVAHCIFQVNAMLQEAIFLATCNATMTNKKTFQVAKGVSHVCNFFSQLATHTITKKMAYAKDEL